MNANINMDEKGLSELYRQDVMVCKSCRKRQQRVKSYKNIAICSIVTCGVFVFSTIVVSLVFFIQLSNRLDDTDNTNAELKARIAVLDRDLQRVFNLIQRSRSLAPYADSVSEESGLLQYNDDPLDSSHRALHVRRKRDVNQKRRRKPKRKKCKTADAAQSRAPRTANSDFPHFEIKGSGESSHDGVFTWLTSDLGIGFRPVPLHGYAKEIQITQTGMYRIYGKVAINGRNVQPFRGTPGYRRFIEHMNPAIGLFLMKRNDEEGQVTLDQTWKTQDQRGVNPYNDRMPLPDQISKTYPLDTLEVSGGFLLMANDVIYLQRASDSLYDPHNERFLNGGEFSRFEAYRYA